MCTRSFVSCLTACVVVAGCSVHPIPDDLSRETTFSIVNNIRCEVKEQVRIRLQELLDASKHPKVRSIPADQVIHRLSTLIQYDRVIASKVLKYAAIVIGYSFEFDITETDENSASASFKVPFTNTTFTLDANGRANFTRRARRTFSINDSFRDLALLNCTGALSPRPNLIHPVTGSIGAANIIDTYLSLGKSGAIGLPQGEAGPFKDQITFTTDIGGGISPEITVRAVPNSFRLTRATARFAASRKDIHKVTIIIPFPSVDDRAGAKLLSQEELSASIIASNTVIAEELCIQRARDAEDGATVLRREAPEIYCRGQRLR